MTRHPEGNTTVPYASSVSSADGILTLTAAADHSVKVNCQTFSKLSRHSILPHQHGIPDSGNPFCEMLRTSNEEMKHGGTMTDHGQREPYRGREGGLEWRGYDRKERKKERKRKKERIND